MRDETSRDLGNSQTFRAAALVLGLACFFVGVYFGGAGALGVIATYPSDVGVRDVLPLFVWLIFGAAAAGLGVNLIVGVKRNVIDPLLSTGLRLAGTLYSIVMILSLFYLTEIEALTLRHLLQPLLLLLLSISCFFAGSKRAIHT